MAVPARAAVALALLVLLPVSLGLDCVEVDDAPVPLPRGVVAYECGAAGSTPLLSPQLLFAPLRVNVTCDAGEVRGRG